MEREFQCPSCGAANLVTNPGILMKVCDYCKTAIYWDEESALRAGRKSIDLPPSSRFRIGATGKITGRTFTVLGRLSYAHEAGTWNEWFIEMEDGEIKWLSEDEGELFLEMPLKLTSPVPPHEELQAGMKIALNDNVGVVEEIGSARCIGGEGQIPFQVEIGEVYPYADGSAPDGSFSFGLEYDAGTGKPTAFIGTILTTKDAASRPEDREAPVGKTSLAIRCPSCGKPYEGPRLETTEMVVCESCGSGLELTEAEAKVVGKNLGKKPRFTFRIGLPLTFEGVRYEVMGRLFYEEVEEGCSYESAEYILYNPEQGYIWLSEDGGHFTMSRPSHVRFVLPPILLPKTKVKVGTDTFQCYERGELTLRWVDGALPWTASVGERTRYNHLIKPPEYADQEITGNEVELFQGRYIGREEMEKAVPQGIKLPKPHGVFSCQPFEAPFWMKGMTSIGAVFIVLNLVLLLYSYAADKNKSLLQEQITASQYKQEYLTKPFTLDHDDTVLCVQGSAPLNNSWLALDFAVVNSSEEVVSEFYGEASYYHGKDSEGYWTEGSRSFHSYFRAAKAGTYRLLVHATGGTGYGGGGRDETVRVAVSADRTISWYFFIPLVIAGVVTATEMIAKSLFETRRWAPVVGGGDDDDDD